MKSRLAASFFWFSAGECRRITRSTISSRSMGTSTDRLCFQINRCFHPQGFESSSRHVHSSATRDDDFSELGPEVSEYHAKQIKLATEKWDCVVRSYQPRRESDGRPIPSRTKPSAKEILATMDPISPCSKFKRAGHSHATTSTNKTKKITDVESSCVVLVKNIVPSVGLSELIEAISVFGKVSSASFAVASEGLRSCNIEFEDADSRRKAVTAGTIGVGGQEFPVHPLHAAQIVAFRIGKIDKRTTDNVIHSRCKVIGDFIGLARTSNGAVDAFFNVSNDSIQHTILQKLNSTVIDRSHWSAHVVTSESVASDSSEASSDNESRHSLGLQIVDHMSKLSTQIKMKKIFLEDLLALYAGIMHIEDLPRPIDSSGGKFDSVS